MRVLVTGAGGYIGTTLVPMLLEQGHAVRAVDRYFFGRERLPIHPRLDIVQDDIRHLTSAHVEGIDGVIDLAAISNDPTGEQFRDATWAVNHRARVRCAQLARAAGVPRYVLPSSCSIYGFLEPGVVADEDSAANPLTTYAKANLRAEEGVLPLADDDFCVVVLRQATVYGHSPRMRLDLAVNGMTYGVWKTGRLPLMRDGTQWRPMVHVKDVASAQIFALTAPAAAVNGRILNVGSARETYRIKDLADAVIAVFGRPVEVEWYGDPDHRSYRVSFARIEALGWRAAHDVGAGVRGIVAALDSGALERTPETITLEWYRTLVRWHDQIRRVEMYGGILDLAAPALVVGPLDNPVDDGILLSQAGE